MYSDRNLPEKSSRTEPCQKLPALMSGQQTVQCEYEFSGVGMWATIASITTMNLNATQEIREKASDQLIENPQGSTVQWRLLNELITLTRVHLELVSAIRP